jgi:hypothetical protein
MFEQRRAGAGVIELQADDARDLFVVFREGWREGVAQRFIPKAREAARARGRRGVIGERAAPSESPRQTFTP